MGVTMRDVAEKANVSIKTVSRVVNNQNEISESTRESVLAVIQELGYRPNMLARGLITQRTHTIGLVVVSITNPFFPEVAEGVQATARTYDHNMFLCSSNKDLEEELHLLNSLAAQGADGIIVFPTRDSADSIRKFADRYSPLIVVNHVIEHPNIGLVLTDIHQGAKLAVDHLVSQGHQNLGMLPSTDSPADRKWREQGFLDAIASQHSSQVKGYFAPMTAVSGNHRQATRQLLADHPEVTALFAYNDLMAIDAIRVCQELGRRVPEDCAVVGFDDIHLASIYTPSLTTIRIDKYDLGRQSMLRLLEMVQRPDEQFPPISLDVELVIRESA